MRDTISVSDDWKGLFCEPCCLFFSLCQQLFCRRHLEARAEEEHRAQQLDPEKLLYPAVDPTNTISASLIQPDAGRVYTLPPKARKWKGSQLSLSDRYKIFIPLTDCHIFLFMLVWRIWCYITLQSSIADDYVYSCHFSD